MVLEASSGRADEPDVTPPETRVGWLVHCRARLPHGVHQQFNDGEGAGVRDHEGMRASAPEPGASDSLVRLSAQYPGLAIQLPSPPA